MKLRKYIMTIGLVSALALSIAACAKSADNTTSQAANSKESSNNSGESGNSDTKESSTEETRTIAYDESVKQLELNFDNVGNLLGISYDDVVVYKKEPKEDKKEEGKRILKYENPAMEFVLYPDASDPMNEEAYLTQAIKTDMKTAWGLAEDMPVKDLVNAVSATSEPVYSEAETEGELAIGKAGQKVVEFESYGYLFRIAYDGDKVTPNSQVGAYGLDLVDSVRAK